MGGRIPGPLGMGPIVAGDSEERTGLLNPVGVNIPGPLGVGEASPLSVTRVIAHVVKDWSPPSPKTTPPIVVRGKTLADVGAALDALQEWGQGGGMLRADPIPLGTSTNLTVRLHANLVLRLPTWSGYAAASAAAKAEWDRMMVNLRIHEERHVAIAVEEADNLAAALIGLDISDIANMVTMANQTMQSRQDQLDADTQNGAKAGVPYGDVFLDTSIS